MINSTNSSGGIENNTNEKFEKAESNLEARNKMESVLKSDKRKPWEYSKEELLAGADTLKQREEIADRQVSHLRDRN